MKSAWAVVTALAGVLAPGAMAVPARAAADDDGYSRGRYGSRGYESREYGSRGYGDEYGYGHRYGYDTFRIGLDNGYEEGLREGRRDGERRRDYRFSNDRRFRRGDAGYRRSFGPRHEYVRGFRSGYERGYRAGYEASRRYAYGRGYGYGRNRYYKDRTYGRYPY